MSPAHTTSRHWRALLGVALAAILATGTALVANGATRIAPASPSGTSGQCPAILVLVASGTTAVSAGGTVSAVSAAQSQAANLAKATTSDDARELLQNLADDLAAYRTALTASPSQSADRRTDIGASVHSDLAALHRLCAS